MRSLQEIENEISEVSRELASVQGRETEVYSRIVGYYRSLRNWNRGKKEEFKHRLMFDTPSQEARPPRPAGAGMPTASSAEEAEIEHPAGEQAGSIRSYAYFFRKTCPNCLPVREVVERLPLAGTVIDVDSEEGLNEAMSNGVFSTPTVIFFDQDGSPVFQGREGTEIKSFFAPLYDFGD